MKDKEVKLEDTKTPHSVGHHTYCFYTSIPPKKSEATGR